MKRTANYELFELEEILTDPQNTLSNNDKRIIKSKLNTLYDHTYRLYNYILFNGGSLDKFDI